MTTYQLLYLRFLQIKRDYPDLNHCGQDPKPPGSETTLLQHIAEVQRERAEREFYRFEYTKS